MTQPLPPMQNDPAFVAGQKVHVDFTNQANAIRGDVTTSDLTKSRLINEAWLAANAEIGRLNSDLDGRQQARADYLAALVPFGPTVPASASAADRSVLLQAWRSALSDARNASPADLAAMLNDAEMFGDDNLLRAVLTVAAENGDPTLIRSWADDHDLSAELDELSALRETILGRGIANLFRVQSLSPIAKPAEVSDLPTLEAAAAAGQAAMASLSRPSWVAQR